MTYKYVGDGKWYPGVPKRDLTDEEWEALPVNVRKIVQDLYRKKRKAIREE